MYQKSLFQPISSSSHEIKLLNSNGERDYTRDVDLNATVEWSNGTWTNVDWNAASDECQWRKKTLAEYGIRSGERAFVCLSK